MDPLTQGVLGATLAQSCNKHSKAATAALLGFIAALIPDLDVFIRSGSDPLLFLEYHRQFTHSLVFIPVGGLLCALLVYLFLGKRLGISFKFAALFCTLGYASHALLDACTSYGTELLWPFSEQRFAWNLISIIDPLYTLPLLTLVCLAVFKAKPRLAQIALLWALLYPGLGLVQRERAEAVGLLTAQQRGHQPVRLEAKPSFANLLLWKVVYESDQHYYVDAVRAGIKPRLIAGSAIKKLDIDSDLVWLSQQSQQYRDVERFRWFSNDYLAASPNNPLFISDVRYSLIPNEISPMWGIELSPDAAVDQHASYKTTRKMDDKTLQRFKLMLLGKY